MKKLIQALSIFLTVWIVLFAIWAFVQWDFNPSRWTADARFFYAFSSLIIGALFFGAFIVHSNPEL